MATNGSHFIDPNILTVGETVRSPPVELGSFAEVFMLKPFTHHDMDVLVPYVLPENQE